MNNKTPGDHLSPSDRAALLFHEFPIPGKLEIVPTKPLSNKNDMALAYSPGVAAPCIEIHKNPSDVSKYTARGNLIAVISNGSAVLGLGNIGPLASKPVMEGKAVLFKKFANIDVFDIEINAPTVNEMVQTITALEPTFGGINLEDIKAPECFDVENELRKRLKIPVFHDDQHGTAIIVAAAVLNGLHLSNKKIEDVKIVTSGAGAAALACLNLLVSLGARKKNIWVCDLDGVIWKGRSKIDRWKAAYVQDTPARLLKDVIHDADIFLGLSAANVLKPELLKQMAPMPLILALANPIPEIMPEEARKMRDDAIICTGRSDYPNQVNNVLCFPYIFRGALDVDATEINEEMKIAAVHAIARLAREKNETAYDGSCDEKKFGPNNLIPDPFDQRLILNIAPAVAKAAMDTGVAQKPILDFVAYAEKLQSLIFNSGIFMKPVFMAAKSSSRQRVIFSDGEDERILKAVQVMVDNNFITPILVGRPRVIQNRIEQLELRLRQETDFVVINPESDPRYKEYVLLLLDHMGRKGVTPELARVLTRTSTTVIAALAIIRDEADALICGLSGRFENHLRYLQEIIGLSKNVKTLASLSLLVTQKKALFLTDTHVNQSPSINDLVEITSLAIDEVRNFGIVPQVALVSHSDFGSHDSDTAIKMRLATQELFKKFPDIAIDGEMHGGTALCETLRKRIFPNSRLKGEANLLVFPNLDSANITCSILKRTTNAMSIGPILMGTSKPAHILTPSVTTRDVINITALSVAKSHNDFS